MTFRCLLIFVFAFIGSHNVFGQIFRVPFSFDSGYGPFQPSFYVLSHSDNKMGWPINKPTLIGISESFMEVETGYFVVDYPQFIFQMLSSGTLDSASLDTFLTDYDLVLNTNLQVSESIRCFIAFMIWKN